MRRRVVDILSRVWAQICAGELASRAGVVGSAVLRQGRGFGRGAGSKGGAVVATAERQLWLLAREAPRAWCARGSGMRVRGGSLVWP